MNYLDMNFQELEQHIKGMGQPAFRAKQIFSFLHKGASFDEMSNLPKPLRLELKEAMPLGGVKITDQRISKIDGTIKYLFLLEDNNIIEGVFMQYKHGNTLCISTQVGCRMGCNFCASTIDGLVRNLNPGEMLGQVLAVQKEQAGLELKQGQRAVTNIVMMGSGEPLDNYDNVLKFFELINSKEGINISLRNISLSTCGLVEEMKRLADSGYAPTLSISLHAPTDQLRKTMMPIANKHSLKEIIEGAQYYIDKTGRRIIFEYALINGINDTPEHAKKLHLLLRGVMCHINLIPLNDVKERDLKGTTYSNARDFCDMLIELNLSATIRREMGNDIEGACGQLRRSIL